MASTTAHNRVIRHGEPTAVFGINLWYCYEAAFRVITAAN